jgi:hypothetical protein
LHAPFLKSSASYCLAHGDALQDPSNPLKNGAVFILGNFVEPLPDEVPIHSRGRLSRSDAYTLPQL